MERTLGGDRVGSGNKLKVRLNHYFRSTHNLSKKCTTSAGCGILYPCYVAQTLRGDKFDINIAAGVRTLPTMGAMFGSYKLQVDYYFCPSRLYIGLLHNNPTKVGLEMNKIFNPLFEAGKQIGANTTEKIEFSTSSLLHYLGLSGVGTAVNNSTARVIKRRFNAIPILSYYDIYKNYYTNKQEETAYILSNANSEVIEISAAVYEDVVEAEREDVDIRREGDTYFCIFPYNRNYTYSLTGYGMELSNIKYQMLDNNKEPIEFENGTFENEDVISIDTSSSIGVNFYVIDEQTNAAYFKVSMQGTMPLYSDDLQITSFPLQNFDDMRMELLSYHTKGAPYIINNFNKLPYKAIAEYRSGGAPWTNVNSNKLQGLAIKTYQADMFNAWLSTEYIDGINGIANITRVSTEGGGFTIDALNFNEKMYDLLNRIIVSGNTYEDWQDVVYEDLPKRHLESPMYLGGLSQEIVFEEIVSSAETEQGNLGKIGGRGISRHRKGGHVKFKCDEAGFIIGIMSITPRINYSQGNAFYFTDVMTMDDLHKPALDQIGFQDLMGERMAYFDTNINEQGKVIRHAIGKLPAWLEYMTAVDEVHGEMADGDVSYMVLNRNYEYDNENNCILDATTYIDPSKYNYAFAYSALDSQNFWVQVENQVKARRKMSAKLMPNI